MATLGSTSKPTTTQVTFGLNTKNQQAIALTLPAGGPWRIYRIGGWLAGVSGAADVKFCLWTSGGSLARNSATFVAASQPFAAFNATNYEEDIADYEVAGGTTVLVGWSRDPADSHQFPVTGSGTRRDDTQTPGYPDDLTGYVSAAGLPGIYLYYEEANSPPDAPVIVSPTAGEAVNDTTPNIDWTYSDPDGDAQAEYAVEVYSNASLTTLVYDSNLVASSSTIHTVASALTRGQPYWVRVKVKDSEGNFSPWSATRSFLVPDLPVGAVTSPGTDTVAPLYYDAGTDTEPKFQPTWSFTCADGGTQTGASIKVYDAAGTSLLHTHAHSGSTTSAKISGYTPTNGTKYQISVTVTCSHGVTGTESAKKRCQVRFGRASYRGDLSAPPTTLSVSVSATANNGQVIMEYASSAATTPEPTDWKATIAEVAKLRYVWHRATLLPQAVASPTSPSLNFVTFSYSLNVLVADKWTLDASMTVDEGTYVYGTQSLRYTGDASARLARQTVAVVPDTDYILSARVKTQGAPSASIRLRDTVTGDVLASADAADDTDWTRIVTGVWNSGSATEVEVALRGSGAVGTNAWFDAVKLEASTVVTPWTPGFLGQAVVLDAGGVMIYAAAGGIFRLRGSDLSNARWRVDLGTKGLVLGGDTILSSPSTGVVEANGVPLGGGAVAPWNLPGDNGTSFHRNVTIGAVNRAILTPVTIPAAVTVRGVRFWVGTSSGNVCVGLYDSSGNRLATSGAVACPTAGVVSDVLFSASYAAAAGRYYLAISCDNTTAQFGIAIATSFAHVVPGRYKATSHPLPSTIASFDGETNNVPVLLGLVTGGFP
jgi:hypothetical protein